MVNDMKVGCIFSVLLFVVHFYTLRHWSKWSYLISSCQILFLIDLYPLFVNWVVSRLTELCEFLQFTTRLQFLFIFHLVFRCFFYFFAYQNNYYCKWFKSSTIIIKIRKNTFEENLAFNAILNEIKIRESDKLLEGS